MEAPERLIAQYSSGSMTLDQLVMGLEEIRRAFPTVSNAGFLGELKTTLGETGVQKHQQALILSTVRTRLKDAVTNEFARGLGTLLFALGSYLLAVPESWPGNSLFGEGWARAMVLIGALGWATGLGAYSHEEWKRRGDWSLNTLGHALGSVAVLGLAILIILSTR